MTDRLPPQPEEWILRGRPIRFRFEGRDYSGFAGDSINATHHRAARSGTVTGTATPLSLGRTLVSYEVVVTDEAGRRLCTSRITCLIRDAAPGS